MAGGEATMPDAMAGIAGSAGAARFPETLVSEKLAVVICPRGTRALWLRALCVPHFALKSAVIPSPHNNS